MKNFKLDDLQTPVAPVTGGAVTIIVKIAKGVVVVLS